ncbi:GNAT family N-acetyltransferase [Roseomonas sp. 18066]|uniref:GNAT family N-acetyltransferase n=1 Tax=Roseomonas sp. 18066 TaxID=2681412 RepID=UPI00190F1D26|nr:GNAT family N-acetyltransferase [Roseomonas sp. 18066]
MTLDIRPARLDEMPILLDWAATEGWNPGLADAAGFHAADPQGFFLGYLDGVPVACISGVRQGDSHGFIGFYIVRPEHRGKGFGIALWRAAMAHLAGRNVGLDGVVAQQANYARSGFAPAWRNLRHAGVPRPVPGAKGVPQLATLADAVALDVAPVPREKFLRGWLAAPGHRALAIPGRGFGVIRPARDGHKIAPLMARDDGAARAIFNALIEGLPGPVVLDIPEPNAAGLALARDAGLEANFEAARMYTGAAPRLDLAACYGLVSLELG